MLVYDRDVRGFLRDASMVGFTSFRFFFTHAVVCLTSARPRFRFVEYCETSGQVYPSPLGNQRYKNAP